jgi:hypothetical protein
MGSCEDHEKGDTNEIEHSALLSMGESRGVGGATRVYAF